MFGALVAWQTFIGEKTHFFRAEEYHQKFYVEGCAAGRSDRYEGPELLAVKLE